ncbi:hypothetical protein RND81_13G052700 [Saponaria officinalis]|uniref:Uncharacterized protein n=1 Tax=Saponaria officinalis TaxID=3572 RepID=A0AAW1GZR4_SAPOF
MTGYLLLRSLFFLIFFLILIIISYIYLPNHYSSLSLASSHRPCNPPHHSLDHQPTTTTNRQPPTHRPPLPPLLATKPNFTSILLFSPHKILFGTIYYWL